MGASLLRQRAVDDAALVGSSGLDFLLDVEDVTPTKGHDRVAWRKGVQEEQRNYVDEKKNANLFMYTSYIE